MKKVWLRALNSAIGKMMAARDAELARTMDTHADDESWSEVEDGMLDALENLDQPSGHRREAHLAHDSRNTQRWMRRDKAPPERRTTQQRVDMRTLRRLIDSEGLRSAAGARAAKVLRSVDGKSGLLTQHYVRTKRDRGRWYATGLAQLQSSPRALTRAAIGEYGWTCDLVNAFPVIVANLLPAPTERWAELRAYARDKREMQQEVSDGFNISVKESKRLLLSLLFGRSLEKWRRERPQVAGPTPPRLTRLCGELARARVLLTEGHRKKGESQLTALSRIVQSVEQEIMSRIEAALCSRGYEIGTLVHDAIILQRADGGRSNNEDKSNISAIASATLAELSAANGWSFGLRVGVSRPGGG